MIVVVDASVAVKWYVQEEHTTEAEYLLDGRFDLHAPELLLPEFGNILWKKCRNNDIDSNTAESALRSLLERPITLHPHRQLLQAAYSGAMNNGHAIYDWIYLALAISMSCQFVTADRRFFLAVRNTPFKKNVIWIEKIIDLT